MVNYAIAGKNIMFDDTKKYLLIKLDDGSNLLITSNKNPDTENITEVIKSALERAQSGELPLEALVNAMKSSLHWIEDAPLMRTFRKMREAGGIVVTTQVPVCYAEGGDSIIDGLENTGKFADYFLNAIKG